MGAANSLVAPAGIRCESKEEGPLFGYHILEKRRAVISYQLSGFFHRHRPALTALDPQLRMGRVHRRFQRFIGKPRSFELSFEAVYQDTAGMALSAFLF